MSDRARPVRQKGVRGCAGTLPGGEAGRRPGVAGLCPAVRQDSAPGLGRTDPAGDAGRHPAAVAALYAVSAFRLRYAMTFMRLPQLPESQYRFEPFFEKST